MNRTPDSSGESPTTMVTAIKELSGKMDRLQVILYVDLLFVRLPALQTQEKASLRMPRDIFFKHDVFCSCGLRDYSSH